MKTIAHTQSGKAIHSTAAVFRGNPGHYGDLNRVLDAELEAHVRVRCADYTAQDHLDAAAAYEAEAAKLAPPALRNDPRGVGVRQYRMLQAARGHARAGWAALGRREALAITEESCMLGEY